jgi:hypothetical protein
MPCKIKIKQHVENLVEQKSQPGLSMSLQDAQILSANINSEFMHHVVSFKNENDVVKRVIDIPSKLVDTYYDLQVKKEVIKTPTVEIKPGVQELFDSNPELANKVYEASGFQEKYEGVEKGDLINELKQITDPYLKEFADLFIQSNINIPLYYSKGNDYAYVVPDNTLIISKGSVGIIKQKSIIHEVLHGGTSNNLLSNSDFKNRIESIINNIKQSDQQGRITFNYELENADEFISGLADKAFGNYLKQKGVFDEVITILKDNISFEKGFKITSQQKQQALQQYSAYLDSIFPDSKVKDVVYHGTNEKFDKFDKNTTYKNISNKIFNEYIQGFYFSEKGEYGKEYPVLLNSKNIKDLTGLFEAANTDIDYQIKQDFNRIGKAIDNNEIDTAIVERPLNLKLKPVGNYVINIKNGNTYSVYFTNDGMPTIANEVAKNVKEEDLASYEKLNNENKEYNNSLNKVYNWYVVFEPEQIHILGSKEDIEGFKKFNNNKQDVSGLNSDINSLNLTPEVVNYLYRSSRSKSKNVSLESYTKEVKKLIDNLRTSYTNEEILEKIKCL